MIQNNTVVLPGDTIKELTSCKRILLGPGLKRQTDETCVVTRSGKLCHRNPNIYWVESHQKSYVPRRGDLVVGMVLAKRGDMVKVDINGSESASLSLLAFESATKKQKPDIQVGDLVYAKLLSANREMEPELVCVDRYHKAGRLGVLPKNGFVFDVLQETVYKLLNYDNPTLKQLGKKFPYEIVVGMNGKIWLNARTVKDIHSVVNTILKLEE